MQFFVEPLLESGFEVIAFDGPAHGASSGFQTTLLKSAKSLRHVASECGPPDVIVGHSFGGVVGSLAVSEGAKHPLMESVKHIVVMSSPDRMTDVLFRFGDQLQITQPALAYVRRRIEKVAGRPIEQLATSSFVAASEVPTLVIHDRDDKEVPVSDGWAIAGSPEARFLGTEGLGHRRILRSKEVVKAVTDFLNDR
jgi:pimeloyl-ACP methyl ester carboxylesterase